MADNGFHEELYSKVVHVLQYSLRTSTYKLATMNAIIDFSASRHLPEGETVLDIPLAELARRVMALYWNQLIPFDGRVLRQSTQSRSRIFDAIESLRSAADCPEDDQTFTTAAKLAPAVFRRAVDNVAVRLAQQPLPRLQRAAGAPKSDIFLYDDSFLHDNVTRAELARNRNCIRLNPGIAEGLARNEDRLLHLVRSIWVDDVLRINKIPVHHRERVESHLFGKPLSGQPTTGPMLAPAEVTTSTFATRLNKLIAKQENYSSGEIAAKMRKSGFQINVGLLTRLQAGVGPPPSRSTIDAFAHFFGVDPVYFTGEADDSAENPAPSMGRRVIHPGRPEQPSGLVASRRDTPKPDPHPNGAIAEDNSGQVFDADLDGIRSACDVRPNACWIRPSNTQVRCRAPGDTRKSFDLPKMGLHRWSWMVANGYSKIAIPSHLVHVTRRCNSGTCCNPQHLVATSPNGGPLSKTAIDKLVRKLSGSSAIANDPQPGPISEGRLVLQADLAWIRNYCSISRSGCWLPPTSGPVACRPKGDVRPDGELRMMAPHRWVWMVANGRSSSPLPGTFYVRRRCGEATCCRPDHLYLTTAHGEEVSLHEAEAILARQESLVDRSSDVTRPTPAAQLFARRVNALFEQSENWNGLPHTSREVAAELQEQGFAISENLIDRIRSGAAELPGAQTIEALGYFFSVDTDYFSTEAPSDPLSEVDSPDVRTPAREAPAPPSAPINNNDVDVSLADVGVLIANLSATISDCLAQDPADHYVSDRLVPLLGAVGDALSAQPGDVAIPQSLLHRAMAEWNPIPADKRNQTAFERLSDLAGDSPGSEPT